MEPHACVWIDVHAALPPLEDKAMCCTVRAVRGDIEKDEFH